MKTVLNNTALKILAVVLSFLMFFAMLISFFSVGVMLFNDFYTRDFKSCETTIMGNLARNELNKLQKIDENGVSDYYSDKNVLYEIENITTGEIFSNLKGQDYIAFATETVYESIYVNINGEIRGENDVDFEYSYTDDGEFFIFDSETGEKLTELDDKQEIKYTVYIPEKMQYTDRFWLTDKLITFGYDNRFLLIFTAIVSLCLCIAVYSYLFMAVGHKSGGNSITPAVINRIPADILTTLVLILGGCGLYFLTESYRLVASIV